MTPISKKPTAASALGVADPALLGHMTLDVIRKSGGNGIGATDEEILAATRSLAREEGLFVEPSGAVTIAGLARGVKEGLIDPGESVVCVVTGSGFKDFERIAEMVQIPERVIGSYDEMLAVARDLRPAARASH